MRILKAVGLTALLRETIKDVQFGSDMAPKCGSYGAYTLFTESGRELVIWNSMGEVNLSEVVEKEWVRGPEPMLDKP